MHDSVTYSADDFKQPPVNIIAAISRENGLEYCVGYDTYINSQLFAGILPKLRNHGGKFTVFGDNASYHFAKAIRKNYTKFGTSFVGSVAYTPELNPVEGYFRMLKAKYRSLYLNKLANGKRVLPRQLLNEAIHQLDNDKVKHLCEVAEKMWE